MNMNSQKNQLGWLKS